jgi:hypothetical protein
MGEWQKQEDRQFKPRLGKTCLKKKKKEKESPCLYLVQTAIRCNPSYLGESRFKASPGK